MSKIAWEKIGNFLLRLAVMALKGYAISQGNREFPVEATREILADWAAYSKTAERILRDSEPQKPK